MERRLATSLRLNEEVVLLCQILTEELQEENWREKSNIYCKKTIRWCFVYNGIGWVTVFQFPFKWNDYKNFNNINH